MHIIHVYCIYLHSLFVNKDKKQQNNALTLC